MPTDELAPLRSAGVADAPAARATSARHARLRRMVEEHHETVWRFLRRLGLDESDTDDAIQDVLIVAMRRLDDIEPRAERSFLCRTAYRVGCRMRAKRPTTSQDGLTDPRPHPDVLVDQKRARDLLDEILVCMSDEHRAVFVLHDIERLTMAEIADVLELKSGTVASRLRRAREDFNKRVARIEARMELCEVKP